MIHIGFRTIVSWALTWLVVVLVAAAPAAAQTQPLSDALAPVPPATPVPPVTPEAPAASDSPRPWAVGVSESEQALALELYVAGNLEFAESRFAQALAKYREAIRHWDHPAIRFNMTVCLINLGQLIEAREHLERSIAYGAGALGADAHAQAVTYRKLLDSQLTHVTISCSEPGAQVTLDGKPLFTGPGTVARFLLPGEHQVVATKPGLQAALQTLALVAGKPAFLELQPTLEIPTPPRMVRRWATWKPWAVLGSGGAIVGLGALGYFAARSDFAAYDRGVEASCPSGCSAAMLAEQDDLTRKKDRAELKQVVAFSLFSVGSAAMVAGVVGLLLNQPRVRLEMGPSLLTIAPASGGATVSMGWGF
jgi:hypothetical protein